MNKDSKKIESLKEGIDYIYSLLNSKDLTKATDILKDMGFEKRKFINTDNDKKDNWPGIYIFTFNKTDSFEADWNKHSNEKKIPNFNGGSSDKILYIGKSIKSVEKRVQDDHYRSGKKSDGNFRTTYGLRLNDFKNIKKYSIACDMFELKDESDSNEALISLLEQVLHNRLSPAVGSKR